MWLGEELTITKILCNASWTETAYRVTGTVLTKMDAIRFADDFRQLSQRDRSNWLEIAYMESHEDDYGGLSLKEKQDKLKEDRDQVRAWKKEVGRQTTARNRLYELFIEVSLRASCANPKALSFYLF
jgi:hypothetical protein